MAGPPHGITAPIPAAAPRLSGSTRLTKGLPLSARERSLALRLSDGKVCPEAAVHMVGGDWLSWGGNRSFDHLVGVGEQRGRQGEVERFCRLQIDQELKLGGLVNRDVTRFGPIEN